MRAEARRNLDRLLAALRRPRGARIALGAAMAVSAWLIFHTAQGQYFAIDELTYYGRLVDKAGTLVQYEPFQPTYLLAPYNGHLQVGGRLIYELLFATVGPQYDVLLLIHIAGLMLCVGLTFELLQRWTGPLAALGPCIVLLFLGFASETLLWPFDLHSTYSLAFSLAAVLALQRDDRRGDIAACALLTLSIAMIEVGIAFAVGIGVWLLADRRRLRRLWIVVLPVALYAAWWLWARKFQQSETSLANLTLIPKTFLDALASTLGSLTGTNPLTPASYSTVVTWFGRALAVVAAVALALRIRQRRVPRLLWLWLAAVAAYWAFLALAERPPEGGRYIFVSAVLMVLVAGFALRRPVSSRLAGVVVIAALVALPANIAQLTDNRGSDTIHHDAPVSRTEFAMLELARRQVDPEYVVTGDPSVVAAGGGLFIGLPAGVYLNAAGDNGSLAFSLQQVRRQQPQVRRVADAALMGALGVALRDSGPPGPGMRCREFTPAAGASGVEFTVPKGATRIRSRASERIALGLRRFGDASSSVVAGELRPRRWLSLEIPPDSAPDPWRAVVEYPVEACFAS